MKLAKDPSKAAVISQLAFGHQPAFDVLLNAFVRLVLQMAELPFAPVPQPPPRMHTLWLMAHGSMFLVADVRVNRQAQYISPLGPFPISAKRGDLLLVVARQHGEGTQ